MKDQTTYEKPSFEVVDVKGCINSWGSNPTGNVVAQTVAAAGEELILVKPDTLHAVDVFGTIIVAATGTQKGVQNVRLGAFVDEKGNTGFQLVADTTPSETPTSFEVSAMARGADANRGGTVRVMAGSSAQDVKITPVTDLISETRVLGQLGSDEVVGISSNGFDMDTAFVDGVRKLQRQTKSNNVAASIVETYVFALTSPVSLNITAVRMKSA